MIEYKNSIMLVNMNMENIAEFMLMRDTDNGYEYVKSISFTGMHEMLRQNASSPLIVWPGMMMPKDTFLGYIANVVRFTADEGIPYPYQMQSMTSANPIRVRLVPGMRAGDISQLTGWEVEYIRNFFKDYFVIH